MFQEFLQQTFFNNRILDYLIFISILFAGIIVLRILKNIIINRLKVWAEKTAHTIDDLLVHLIEKKVLPLFYLGVFYLAIQSLTLIPKMEKVINIFFLLVLAIYTARFLLEVINYAFQNYWLKKEEDLSKKNVIKVILTFIKVILWSLVLVVFLDNIGVEISALIAGLGIGGIAIALAAQTILGDLFSYFIIFFDRPFKIGDFIIVGDYMGAVQHIGLKTTRVSSLGGEQLVFSNTDLTNSRVRNYKRMDKRRVVFSLGVTYQTKFQQLKEIPGIITDIINKINDAVFDRAHFFSYGDFSLIFEVVYYVVGNDYNKYMNIQQEINYNIHEEFEKRGIEFAYPTQTLFVNKA
jgi:small-conductance mechanosensitive channel